MADKRRLVALGVPTQQAEELAKQIDEGGGGGQALTVAVRAEVKADTALIEVAEAQETADDALATANQAISLVDSAIQGASEAGAAAGAVSGASAGATAAQPFATQAQAAAQDAEDYASLTADDRVQTGLDRTAAANSAAAATAARDAAYVNADVYTTIASGRASVADGQQFSVVTGQEIIRYRRDTSTTQTEIARWSTSAAALNSGKIIGSRTAAVDMGQAGLPSTTGLITIREGEYISYRGFGVSDPAADPLFSTLPYWGVIFRVPSSDIGVAMSRISGVIPLESVGGTANAITASVQSTLAGYGIVPGPLSKLEITPTANNTGPTTLAVATDVVSGTPVARAVLTETGVPIGANALVTGRTYQLRRRGEDYRIVGGAVTASDVSNLQTAIVPIAGAVRLQENGGDVIAAIQDSDGNGTFMTARALDGAPTLDAARLIGTSMREAGELAGSLVRPNPDGTWAHPSGGRFASADVNMQQIVAWGSSSTVYSDASWGAMAVSFGASYIPLGQGGSTNEHVLIQIGAVKPTVTGGTLAAGAGSTAVVTVETISTAREVAMRSTPGLLVNGATQIRATLSYNGTALQVTRTEAGTSVSLTSGWRFWSDNERLRNRMALVWSGKNDLVLNQDAASMVAEVQRITDYLSPLVRRYLVLGHFPNTDSTTAVKAQIVAADALLSTLYGNLFIPVMPSLLGTQIFTDLGLIATPEDIAARSAGSVPPSLMMDNFHLSLAAYGWLTDNLVRPKLLSDLGWYRDVTA